MLRRICSGFIALVVLAVSSPLAMAEPVPTWDKVIENPTRFKILADFAGQAVLDRETGLVWQRSPSTISLNWNGALNQCYSVTVGSVPTGRNQSAGRKGWRLPTVEELASLIDPGQFAPVLGAGHPFTDVQLTSYWTITSGESGSHSAFVVDLANGGALASDKSAGAYVWCVRGGHGHNGQ